MGPAPPRSCESAKAAGSSYWAEGDVLRLGALHEALALQARGLGSQRKPAESDSSTEVTQHHFHCTLLIEMDTSLPGFKGKELRPRIFMKVKMPRVKAAQAGRQGPAKRRLAEHFSAGEIITDMTKKEWKLGSPVGQGGFGCIYLADMNSSKSVGSDAPCVVKVEPSDNGPLFTELKFYQRAAKPEQIQKWIRTHKLKYLGVPKYWGSGLHDKNGKSYRFMIIDRFGSDLQKIYEANAKRFSRKTVLQLSLRILDILEYIHEHEYVHGDIKASNLLLSYKNPDQVYLVDYGLAYRYCPEGAHKEYKEDPKRCHDGTIEFTSIDAHNGVAPSRRGDLEILGYCMIQWLSGHLPWEDNLRDPNYVRDSKIRYRENIASLMDKCFPEKNKPDEIAKYMETVKLLDYVEKPLYQKLRDILLQGLKAIGSKDDGKLDLTVVENGSLRTKPVAKRKKEAEQSVECSVEDMECSDKQTEEATHTRSKTRKRVQK
ncbi:serine/threonine-protein kinase VRK1 isoform X2 [Odocoileus virginianus]|uniref:non-specific serine/threonine protein kinase n=1 Tax=Odocoileus virginianus TaxID=9874 RepID=A0ABM4J1L9_ODOVR